MHTLRLHMPNNKLADRGASSFSRLSGLVLRCLQLDLRDNNIGCEGLPPDCPRAGDCRPVITTAGAEVYLTLPTMPRMEVG